MAFTLTLFRPRSAEHFSTDSLKTLHFFAHKSNDREVVFYRNRIDSFVFRFHNQNLFLSIFLACVARSFSIPIQIECSDEACVIMMTLIFAFASVDSNFFEYPGIPIIPLPSSVSKGNVFRYS